MTTKTFIIPAIGLLAISCSSKPEYDAQGTFEATEITVSSEANGKILSLNIEEGDTVLANFEIGVVDTTLLHLQRMELLRQQSATVKSRPDVSRQVASLKEQIEGAKVERDRIARLLQDNAATQQQLDNANTRLATLQAQLTGQISSLDNTISSLDDRASVADVQIASIDYRIAQSVVRSPINGVVITKVAQPGEVTAFGKPLFKVADLDNMYLRAYFTSDRLADLKLGMKVKVVADYGDGNTRDYDGTISFISPTSEFTPKTIQTKDSRANLVYAVKIAVKNDGLLKTGLTGEVYVNNSDKNK